MNRRQRKEFLEQMKVKGSVATIMPPASMPYVKEYKVGRNDVCPCGSGRKYKQCCINKGTYENYKSE